MVLSLARIASAQVTPAAGFTPPDDTPSIKVGVTIYTDFTYQPSPDVTDSDGNVVNPSSFNVTRSYINVTGNLNHIVAFRITPDVTRESGLVTLGPGSTISNDSLVFRIKYAFAQINLDDWMTKGSWVRFGIQQTPLLDYEEGIYRYRFQGTTFTEREGFYNSADGGAGFHYNFPANYGDVHIGVYNGEGYAKTDPNDQKAIEVRGSVRPFAAAAPILRGLRVTGFYFGDNYIKNAERTRAVGQVTFEAKYLNAGFDAIKAHDQPSIKNPDVAASGWSWWATPKLPFESTASVEALLRYDHLQPNTLVPADRTRTIVGLAYWFKNQGTYQSALLLDYDGQVFHDFVPAQPKQTRVALHALINF
jgi:Phosphate-selective porin O and P